MKLTRTRLRRRLAVYGARAMKLMVLISEHRGVMRFDAERRAAKRQAWATKLKARREAMGEMS